MTVLGLNDVHLKDSPVHYRSEYRAAALIHFTGKQEEIPVLFSIEHTATGTVDIVVKVRERINYPLLPVLGALKTYISDMYSEGKLPE